MARTATFDGLACAPYDDRLYAPTAIATQVDGWEAVEVEKYREYGFVPVANAFDSVTCDAAVEGLVQLASRDGEVPYELQFESAVRDTLDSMSPQERLDSVRKLMWFVPHESRLRALAEDPRMMTVVTELLGAEPEMYQEMALMKPPGIGREKPWHQDHAYFDLPEGTPVIGVWIALDAATVENGCMIFQPGGHREGPRPHFNVRDWQLCDADVLEVQQRVAAPLPRGGALIFDGLTPHGTAQNRSGSRRRAIQFHYVPKGTPRLKDERLRIFGAEGFGATC
ncbi:N/A [soil metagenome]